MARFEEGRSISCPPLFEGEAYFQWSNVMKYFILAQDIKVWVVIENGYMEAPKKKKKQRSENDTKAKLNSRAMHMLLCGLNEEVSKNVSTCKSAKEIWEKLEKLYGKEEKKYGVPSCANLIQSSKVDGVLVFNEPEQKILVYVNHELANSRSNRTPKLYDRIVKLRNEHLRFRIPEIAQNREFPEKNQKLDFFLKRLDWIFNLNSKVRKLLPEASKNRKSQFPEQGEIGGKSKRVCG
ncbi:hypothetical protein GQ457_03G012590 [Hibiscus cannabinus]